MYLFVHFFITHLFMLCLFILCLLNFLFVHFNVCIFPLNWLGYTTSWALLRRVSLWVDAGHVMKCEASFLGMVDRWSNKHLAADWLPLPCHMCNIEGTFSFSVFLNLGLGFWSCNQVGDCVSRFTSVFLVGFLCLRLCLALFFPKQHVPKTRLIEGQWLHGSLPGGL